MHDIAASPRTLSVKVKYQAASIDAARIFAIIWIAVFHVLDGGWGGIAGVSVFLALSLGLMPSNKTWVEFAKDRTPRLLVPWIFWSTIYGLWLLSKHAPFKVEMLLYGPRIHLWFLPYLFVTSLVAYAVLRARPRTILARRIITMLIIAGTCASIIHVSYLMHSYQISAFPFQQWLTASPSVTLGISYRLIRNDRDSSAGLLAALIIMTAAATLYAWSQYGSDVAGPIACALIILGLVWATEDKLPSPSWLTYCAGLTFGVYLSHVAILDILRKIQRYPHGSAQALLYIVIVVLGAAVLTALIQKFWPQRLKRWAIV